MNIKRFAVCFVIFLFYAGIVYESKGKKVIWLATLSVFIGFVIYALLASGLSLYIDIIKGDGIYAEQGALVAMTYCVLVISLFKRLPPIKAAFLPHKASHLYNISRTI